MDHALVQEDSVEVVVPEEDCQLIWAQTLSERCQTMEGELTGAVVQKLLHSSSSHIHLPALQRHRTTVSLQDAILYIRLLTDSVIWDDLLV